MTDKIDVVLDANQKGLKDALETIELLRLNALKTQDVFSSYAVTFQKINKEIGAAGLQLGQFFRDLGKYSKGSLNSQAVNAEITRAVNNTKAQFRDLTSVVVNEQAKSLSEQLRGLKNQNLLKNLGLDNASGPITNLNEISKKMEAITAETKRQATEQAKLNTLRDQYQRKLIEFNTRGEVSKSSGDDVLRKQLDLARAKNLLELNSVQIKKAQATQDELLVGILTKRQASLRKIIISEEQSLKNAREHLALAGKQQVMSDKQKAAQSRAFSVERVTGDGGASLFKIQASLLVNYMLMNQLFNLFQFGTQFVLELDKSFQNLQATIAATDGQMVSLKSTIIDVSKGTKFTAVEVAQAAEVLGQAGFTVEQIKSSIEGVTLLATATGSTLGQSVDVASSAIGVFNLRAEDMTHVANVMTGAINETKLTMDKLALGLQYAGNIAAEAGLSFEETTAILGAMSNAGIRSGSTLGTGLRQLLTEFISPSEKFAKSLTSVGLSIDDVDVKAKGFVGVLNTLREAGFSATNAFESLDLRAAAAFAAIQNDPEIINRLQESFIYSTAAAKANEVQMKSLSNTFDQFRGALGALVSEGSGPVVSTLVGITKAGTGVLNFLSEGGVLLTSFTTALTISATAFGAFKVQSLIINLFKTQAQLEAVAAASQAAAVGMTNLQKAAMLLRTPIGAISIAIAALIGGMQLFDLLTTSTAESLDAAKTSFANAQGEVEKTDESVRSIDESLDSLITRFGELKDSPETVRTEFLSLQNRFGSLGFKIENETKPSIESLIEALQRLKTTLGEVSAAQTMEMLSQRANLFNKEAGMARDKIQAAQNNKSAGYDRLFTSDDITSRSYGAVKAAGAVSGANFNMDLNSASQAQIEQAKARVQAVITMIYDSNNELNKALPGLRKAAQNGDKSAKSFLLAYEDRLESNNTALVQIQTQMGGLNDFVTKQKDTTKKVFETTELYTEYMKRIDTYNQDVSKLRSELAKETDPKKKEALENEIIALEAALDKFLQKLIFNKVGAALRTMEETTNERVDSSEIINLVKSMEVAKTTSVAETNQKLARTVEAGMSAAENAAEQARNFVDFQKELMDRVAMAYEREIKRLDAVMKETTDLERGGLAGKYTDAELSMFQDRQKGLENKALKAKIDQGPSVLAALDNLIGAQSGIVGKNAKLGGLNNSPDTAKELAKSQKELLDLEQERADVLNELNTMQDEYNARMGIATDANVALGDQIKYVLEGYSKQMEIQSQVGYNIKENLTSALDEGRESFGGFLSDFLSGTKSMEDSVRSMVTSFLQSMLKLSTDKFAAEIFGAITGGLGSMFGGGGSGSVTAGGAHLPSLNPNLNIPDAGAGGGFFSNIGSWFGLKDGGYIRKAGGGANNRDSVKALLRPGEYVLRNQAVDMIGRENLDEINGMGARSFSASGERIPEMGGGKGGMSVTNVWVVSPDQKPSLTKDDVLVTITEDIMSGGTTKKLIKSVTQGNL